jgi:hypothetical protein
MSLVFGAERFLQEVIPRYVNMYKFCHRQSFGPLLDLVVMLRQRMAAGKGFGCGKAAHNTVSQVLL